MTTKVIDLQERVNLRQLDEAKELRGMLSAHTALSHASDVLEGTPAHYLVDVIEELQEKLETEMGWDVD